MELINNDKAFAYLVDDMIFLEEQLKAFREKLKEFPNKNIRRVYKDYLSQYVNVVKCISKASGNIDDDEDGSSLGEWLEEFKKNGIDRDAVHSR